MAAAVLAGSRRPCIIGVIERRITDGFGFETGASGSGIYEIVQRFDGIYVYEERVVAIVDAFIQKAALCHPRFTHTPHGDRYEWILKCFLIISSPSRYKTIILRRLVRIELYVTIRFSRRSMRRAAR